MPTINTKYAYSGYSKLLIVIAVLLCAMIFVGSFMQVAMRVAQQYESTATKAYEDVRTVFSMSVNSIWGDRRNMTYQVLTSAYYEPDPIDAYQTVTYDGQTSYGFEDTFNHLTATAISTVELQLILYNATTPTSTWRFKCTSSSHFDDPLYSLEARKAIFDLQEWNGSTFVTKIVNAVKSSSYPSNGGKNWSDWQDVYLNNNKIFTIRISSPKRDGTNYNFTDGDDWFTFNTTAAIWGYPYHNRVECIMITISAHCPPCDMNDTIIEAKSKEVRRILKFGNTANLTHYNVTILRDPNGLWASDYIVEHGTAFRININTEGMNLTAQKILQVIIIPKSGPKKIIKIKMPDYIRTEDVEENRYILIY